MMRRAQARGTTTYDCHCFIQIRLGDGLCRHASSITFQFSWAPHPHCWR
jgi:hypothetical protein